MMWLVIALGLVIFMKESMEVYDGYGHKLNYGILDLLRVPYDFAPRRHSPDIGQETVDTSPTETKPDIGSSTLTAVDTGVSSINTIHCEIPERSAAPNYSAVRSTTIASYEGAFVRVVITMPSNFGFRSWRCYEAVIEVLAVGIYLYATFVLTSTLFLNADRAIIYSTVMTVCLSAVRVLVTLF